MPAMLPTLCVLLPRQGPHPTLKKQQVGWGTRLVVVITQQGFVVRNPWILSVDV